jgi:hypothetical protein
VSRTAAVAEQRLGLRWRGLGSLALHPGLALEGFGESGVASWACAGGVWGVWRCIRAMAPHHSTWPVAVALGDAPLNQPDGFESLSTCASISRSLSRPAIAHFYFLPLQVC